MLGGLQAALTSGGCEVTVAAHGLAGSSEIAFGLMSRLLVRMLVDPAVLGAEDADLWRITDECFRAAYPYRAD